MVHRFWGIHSVALQKPKTQPLFVPSSHWCFEVFQCRQDRKPQLLSGAFQTMGGRLGIEGHSLLGLFQNFPKPLFGRLTIQALITHGDF